MPRRAGRCRSTRGRALRHRRRRRGRRRAATAARMSTPWRARRANPRVPRPVGWDRPSTSDLGDPAPAHGVDRHRRRPRSPSQRAHRREAAAVNARCPGQRLRRAEPGRGMDRPSRRSFHEPEPTAGQRREHRDRDVGPARADGVHEGAGSDAVPSRSASANSQMPAGEAGRAPPRPRAPAPARCPQDRGAGDQRHRARPVRRAVVHDHHLVREPHERRDRRPDAGPRRGRRPTRRLPGPSATTGFGRPAPGTTIIASSASP